MRLRFIILLAPVALLGGIGIAELQLRGAAEPLVNEVDLSELDRIQAIAAHANAFSNQYDARKAAHADCAFRLPKGSVLEWCIGDQMSAFEKMTRIFKSEDLTGLQRGAILVCLEENQSLNGYDWEMIPACFERMVVSLR